MENRVLLAFALSMAVFFVYMQYFGPQPQPVPTAGPAAPGPVTTATPVPQELVEAPPAAEVVASPPVAVAATSVSLANGLVQAELSTDRGFTQWVLSKYKVQPGKTSPAVDLAELPGALPATQLYLLEDTRPVTFALQAHSENAVTISAALTPQLIESRAWKLNGYMADLEWSVNNTGSSAVLLHPRAQINGAINYAKMTQYESHSPIVARGGEIERPDEKEVLQKTSYTSVKWAGLDDKYFLKTVLLPEEYRDATARVFESGRVDGAALVAVEISLPAQTLKPGGTWTTKLRFYIGPKTVSSLKATGQNLEESVDHGFFGFLARPLLALMNLFKKVTGNYGIAIILVTVLIKILFYPLTRKSFTAMRDMQRVQPKLEALKKKYAKDKERMNRELMTLYRTEGINPLGGCLPMVLQIPVFFALYQVLLNSIELRHAPFLFWINDLSSPEFLYDLHLAGFTLPIRLLPLIMGVTMVLQQKMTPSTMDKTQQQIMMVMPVMFTFLFWGFPAGLVLYWLINNVISISQQWYINRGLKVAQS